MRAKLPLPTCCDPDLFEAFTHQVPFVKDPTVLFQSLMLCARPFTADVSVTMYDAVIDSWVSTVRSRTKGRQPQGRLAHLHDFLFVHLGFRRSRVVNRSSNYLLPYVLDQHIGSPLILCLIYKLIADRLGFKAWVISLPQKYLIGLELDGKNIYIDPCAEGKEISLVEIQDHVRHTYEGKKVWNEVWLEPQPNLLLLMHALKNLIDVFDGNMKYHELAIALELQLVVCPTGKYLKRDLGNILARLSKRREAVAFLTAYLADAPNDPESKSIEKLIRNLNAVI